MTEFVPGILILTLTAIIIASLWEPLTDKDVPQEQ